MSLLAARWVGFHAVAFGLGRLLLDVLWGAAAGGAERWVPAQSGTWAFLSVLIPATLTALAQALLLRGGSFPAPWVRWGFGTLAGWALAGAAGWMVEKVMPGHLLFATFRPMEYRTSLALARITKGVAEGAVLALFQGSLLFRRVRGREAVAWMASVLAAWVALVAASYVPSWREADLVGNPHVLDPWIALTRALIAAGSGALFAAVLLPALLHLLRRPVPS